MEDMLDNEGVEVTAGTPSSAITPHWCVVYDTTTAALFAPVNPILLAEQRGDEEEDGGG